MKGVISSVILLIFAIYCRQDCHAQKCGDDLGCPASQSCLYSNIMNDSEGGMCTCKKDKTCAAGFYCGTDGYTNGLCQCENDTACGVGFECVTKQEGKVTERTCKPKVKVPKV